MLNIGRKQKLVVVKKVEFGIYLGETREAGEKERVLLPIKQVPEGTKEGDELMMFCWRSCCWSGTGTKTGKIPQMSARHQSRLVFLLCWSLIVLFLCRRRHAGGQIT